MSSGGPDLAGLCEHCPLASPGAPSRVCNMTLWQMRKAGAAAICAHVQLITLEQGLSGLGALEAIIRKGNVPHRPPAVALRSEAPFKGLMAENRGRPLRK